MAPTEIIKEWLQSETSEVQGDIAFLALSSLTENNDLLAPLEKLVPHLLEWLTPGDEPSFRTVGKALSFVAVFDFLYSSRFVPEGWERPRSMFEQVMDEAPSESMVGTAESALADMPRKEQLWAGVGSRWQAVKGHLAPDYLESWRFFER